MSGLDYADLNDAFEGGSFGQRKPITDRKDVKETFESKADKKADLNKLVKDIESNSAPFDGPKEEFKAYAVPAPVTQRMAIREQAEKQSREHFAGSQPAGVFDAGVQQQSEKLSRSLRLIEQNRTGYERPVVQDMLLYVFTGVVFLFTFDTFVMMGKSMRGK
jgi:hypothetical protein